MPGLGTLLNVAAIVAGAAAGTLLGERLPERLRDALVAALGLFTLTLGVQQPWPVPSDGRRPCWCSAPCWREG